MQCLTYSSLRFAIVLLKSSVFRVLIETRFRMTHPKEIDATLIDVKLLRLLDLLYDTRSVTRCAELLEQSQPTISIWLSRLRRELHDPLFVRSAEGMLPTPRADALIVHVRDALAALRRLSAPEHGFDPASSERRFRICMTDASHVTMLPQLFAHVHALAPSVTLEALGIAGGTAGLLQAGEADLALGLVPELESGFYQQALYPQDWICLVNRYHQRIGEQLNLERYGREGHVGILSGSGSTLLRETLKAQQVERRVAIELPGFLGLAAIVSTTDLIATVPRHIGNALARSASLRILPCPLPIPPFIVKQYWHARFHHDSGNRWLREMCVSLFQHEPLAAAC